MRTNVTVVYTMSCKEVGAMPGGPGSTYKFKFP